MRGINKISVGNTKHLSPANERPSFLWSSNPDPPTKRGMHKFNHDDDDDKLPHNFTIADNKQKTEWFHAFKDI